MVASWGEHLRQHHRFTQDDVRIEQMVRQFHIDPNPPIITHFVAQTDKLDETPAPVPGPSLATLEGQ